MKNLKFSLFWLIPVFALYLFSAAETLLKTKKFLHPLGLSYYPYVFTGDFFFVPNSVEAEFVDGEKTILNSEQIFGLHRPISINGDTYYCITRFHILPKEFCDAVSRKICKKAQLIFEKKIVRLNFLIRYDQPKKKSYLCE